MLIRSQDKKTLFNHDFYTVAINRIKPWELIAYPPTSTGDENVIVIGTYDAGRAMEVLDELEYAYQRWENRFLSTEYQDSYCTFQMPTE